MRITPLLLAARHSASHAPGVWATRAAGQHGHYLLGCQAAMAKELGNIGFVDLVPLDTTLLPGRPFAMVESPSGMKTLTSPIAGIVVDAHEALVSDDPSLAGLGESDPDASWLIRVDGCLDPGEDEVAFNALDELKLPLPVATTPTNAANRSKNNNENKNNNNNKSNKNRKNPTNHGAPPRLRVMERGFSYEEATIICRELDRSRDEDESYAQGWKRAHEQLQKYRDVR